MDIPGLEDTQMVDGSKTILRSMFMSMNLLELPPKKKRKQYNNVATVLTS